MISPTAALHQMNSQKTRSILLANSADLAQVREKISEQCSVSMARPYNIVKPGETLADEVNLRYQQIEPSTKSKGVLDQLLDLKVTLSKIIERNTEYDFQTKLDYLSEAEAKTIDEDLLASSGPEELRSLPANSIALLNWLDNLIEFFPEDHPMQDAIKYLAQEIRPQVLEIIRPIFTKLEAVFTERLNESLGGFWWSLAAGIEQQDALLKEIGLDPEQLGEFKEMAAIHGDPKGFLDHDKRSL